MVDGSDSLVPAGWMTHCKTLCCKCMSQEQWTLAGTVAQWLAHALINPKLPRKQAASWRSCSKAGKDKIAGQGKGFAIIIIDLGQIGHIFELAHDICSGKTDKESIFVESSHRRLMLCCGPLFASKRENESLSGMHNSGLWKNEWDQLNVQDQLNVWDRPNVLPLGENVWGQ